MKNTKLLRKSGRKCQRTNTYSCYLHRWNSIELTVGETIPNCSECNRRSTFWIPLEKEGK